MLALQREAAWAEERLSGHLQQSVPQNGRVHLHSIHCWTAQKKKRTMTKCPKEVEKMSTVHIGDENSARSFLTEVFLNPPGVMDVRAFGSWMSAPKCLFFQDFEGLSEVFAPARPPGYPCGRPPDIRPQNLLFGLLLRSWTYTKTTEKGGWAKRPSSNTFHIARYFQR